MICIKVKFISALLTAVLLPLLFLSSCLIDPVNKEVSGESTSVMLPIIMYHSLLKDESLQNEYTVSPDMFEEDLKYLKNNGYTFLTVSDLVNYTLSDYSLPEKCIMLTFDDGYYNNYYYAFPLLKKYEAKAVISPIGAMTKKFTETDDISPTYGHINEDNIREMTKSGLVEIQNHSYDMHRLSPRRGVGIKRGESERDYTAAIKSDIEQAQEYIQSVCGSAPQCFVYPFGEMNEICEEEIKSMGFVCTLTCTEKTNFITKSPESLFNLGRYRRDREESISALMERIA